jgi:hypothetical protein
MAEASAHDQKPTPPKQGWLSKHKKKVLVGAVLAAVGSMIFVYIFTHTGS